MLRYFQRRPAPAQTLSTTAVIQCCRSDLRVLTKQNLRNYGKAVGAFHNLTTKSLLIRMLQHYKTGMVTIT